METLTIPSTEASLGVIWICLNEVSFAGNEEAMREHRRLLVLYRRRLAKVQGCDPSEVQSDILSLYDEIKKDRRSANRLKLKG